jgi:hypothetical protein
MKVTNILTACGAVLAIAILSVSCKKATGKEVAAEENNFANKSLVQVFDATVNSAATHVFIDGNQATGTALTYGTVFPASSYAFKVDAGLRSFNIRNTTAGTTQTPITFAENMDVNKNYTIFMYDTITSAKQITVPTNIVIPADTTARVRFANFIYAPFTPPGIDIFSFLKGANVATNLKVTEVTDFMPYPSRLMDTLYFSPTGTTNVFLKLVITGTGFIGKRSYTVVYRGSEPRGIYPGTRTASVFTNY